MHEDLGNEVVAPSGYYVPLKEEFLDHKGKRVLYILGSSCIEASCCGVSSWTYARVHGYVAGAELSPSRAGGGGFPVDTIEDDAEKRDISRLLMAKHPGVRIEFR